MNDHTNSTPSAQGTLDGEPVDTWSVDLPYLHLDRADGSRMSIGLTEQQIKYIASGTNKVYEDTDPVASIMETKKVPVVYDSVGFVPSKPYMCAVCNDSGVVGTPGATCPFCKKV